MAAIHTTSKARSDSGAAIGCARRTKLFEGQVWTGRKAVELGVVDGLGDLHAVLRERFGDKVKLPQIGAARPWWRRRLSVRRRDAEAGAIAEAVLDVIAERTLWARYGLR